MQKIIMALLGFVLGVSPMMSLAQNDGSKIYIKVGEAKVEKSLLAIPPIQFSGNPATSSGYNAIGAEISSVLKNNMDNSGYFNLMNPAGFLENPKAGLKPKGSAPNGFSFDSWKTINADFLLKTGFSMSGDSVTLEGYIYHVDGQRLILGRQYRGTKKSIRRIVHTFSNDIIEALTGKKGMFLSRVAVVSDRGEGDFREVWVMDWDGANAEQVSFHRSIAVSPAWSPDGNKISYTAFVKHKKSGKRNADLFIYDMAEKKRWLVSYKDGMNSGSVFSPSGNSIFMTKTDKTGDPEIYEINLKGEDIRQVTSSAKGVLNVEPAISPDGQKLLFSSTRHGNPMIYKMNANGSGDAVRMTRVGKYNASPAWSPDGKKIAFAGHQSGHFDIYVMDANDTVGTSIKKLTSAKKRSGSWADNEDPTWSPDGRYIMFVSNRTGKKQLFKIGADGSNERQITNDNNNYTKPKWSNNFD